ncbi:MAG: metallophosphoesterase [Bacteroidia bacterium]|nr:metallophosphoesterase [Bacteroidia bacterium]
MKRHQRLILLLTAVTAITSPVAADSLKVALVTDIHYFSPALFDEGEALHAYEQLSGRRFSLQHKVLDQVWRELLYERPDLLLIPGDLTHHGERQSHLGLIARLHEMEKSGTRVLVVPGNHDINIPNAVSYQGHERLPVESITKDEFAALYEPFGYGEAIRRDESSLSYVATLDEEHWILCFDSNRYDEHDSGSITAGRIRPQTMAWALSVLREAREKGITVLGMMHHGVVEHMPYQSTFFPDYLVEEWEQHAEALADAGMPIIFTGHFHSNDVTLYSSSSGNKIYDVETATLAHYPFAWRMMVLAGDSLHVESRFLTALPGDVSLEEEARRRLEGVTYRVAEGRLKGFGFPLPEDLMPLLTDLIVKLYLQHVKGDERVDPSLMEVLRKVASYMENEEEINDLAFDFPPEDLNVKIGWEK